MARRVLVIDDDHAFLRMVGRLLAANGDHPITAATGRAGILAARRHLPEVALLDIFMPDTNGFELFKDLRAQPGARSLPVVFLTGNSDDEGILESASADISGIPLLRKPFTLAELLAAINRACAARQARARVLERGGIRLDRDRREVWVAGRRIRPIGPRRMELLEALLRSSRGLSFYKLGQAAWGKVTRRHTIMKTMMRLRRDLGFSQVGPIITVPGGYRIVDSKK